MLLITVPSTGESKLTFSVFERLGLPAPVGGIDSEINDELLLRFEDEEEAVIYAAQLENLSTGLDDKSSIANLAVNDMIMAIYDDEFIQTYLK